MAILIGIDEAGYGPLLGPLCVGIAVFRVDFGPHSDLWKRLDAAVCRTPRDRRGRIAIDDSKKLKRPNDSKGHPLEHLERGVLAFLSCTDAASSAETARAKEAAPAADAFDGSRAELRPADDRALLESLGALPNDSPHWCGSPTPIPLANDPALLGIASARLARALAEASTRLLALRVCAVDAPEFNGALARTRSKASINTTLAFEHLLGAARRHADDDLFIALDRHGGRTHYREELAFTFRDAVIRVLEESDDRSAYEVRERGRCIHACWESESESKHLPVALASMAAKLTRELWMARLNRFFAQHLPELKPTAGYVEDGRRWLAEVEPHLPRIGIDRSRLVRNA